MKAAKLGLQISVSLHCAIAKKLSIITVVYWQILLVKYDIQTKVLKENEYYLWSIIIEYYD